MPTNSLLNILIIIGAKYLYALVVIIAIIYLLTLLKKKRGELILFTIIALPAAYIIAKITSLLYYDPRPFVIGNFAPLVAHVPDNGFPSDHTLLVSAISMIVFFYNKKLSAALWIITILVGISRVLSGIHHPIDIIGSIIISIVITTLVYKIHQHILTRTLRSKRSNNQKPRTKN